MSKAAKVEVTHLVGLGFFVTMRGFRVKSLVEKYARDLRHVLGRDVGRARLMLSRLLGDVTLKPEKEGLWASMRGDLSVLLDGAGSGTSSGAGRGI